jgi:hypothetical protein
MGIKISNKNNVDSNGLKLSELEEFHNITLFSNEILIKLYEIFKFFSSIKINDGVIDYSEFLTILNKKDLIITKRIFDSIDVNSDGSLNYREFIKFFSVFVNGNFEEKTSLSFKIFMDKEKKKITFFSMKKMLFEIIKENNFLNDDDIENVCYESFKNFVVNYKNINNNSNDFNDESSVIFNNEDVNENCDDNENFDEDEIKKFEIDLENYREIVKNNPEILELIKIDINKILKYKINNIKQKNLSCLS